MKKKLITLFTYLIFGFSLSQSILAMENNKKRKDESDNQNPTSKKIKIDECENEDDTDYTKLLIEEIDNKEQSLEKIKHFIDHKADVNFSEGEFSPLVIILMKKEPSLEIIQTLIEAKANVNTQNKSNTSPLTITCLKESPSLDIIKFLLEKNANPNFKENDSGTAFHYICSGNNPSKTDAAKLLLSWGANPTTQNQYGNTPLHYIAMSNNPSMSAAKEIFFWFINLKAQDVIEKINCNQMLKKIAMTFALCAKEKQKITHIKIPKYIMWEILKYRGIPLLLNEFVNTVGIHQKNALTIVQEKSNPTEDGLKFITFLEEFIRTIPKGYDALIIFLKK